MGRYAARTQVPVTKSRADIEKELTRYGATSFGYAHDETRASIYFRMEGRHYHIILPVSADLSAQDQRQRWRALLLVIKAKLEAVECEISTLEREFLAHMVLPDGSTVGDYMEPQLQIAYQTGSMPALLPPPEDS